MSSEIKAADQPAQPAEAKILLGEVPKHYKTLISNITELLDSEDSFRKSIDGLIQVLSSNTLFLPASSFGFISWGDPPVSREEKETIQTYLLPYNILKEPFKSDLSPPASISNDDEALEAAEKFVAWIENALSNDRLVAFIKCSGSFKFFQTLMSDVLADRPNLRQKIETRFTEYVTNNQEKSSVTYSSRMIAAPQRAPRYTDLFLTRLEKEVLEKLSDQSAETLTGLKHRIKTLKKTTHHLNGQMQFAQAAQNQDPIDAIQLAKNKLKDLYPSGDEKHTAANACHTFTQMAAFVTKQVESLSDEKSTINNEKRIELINLSSSLKPFCDLKKISKQLKQRLFHDIESAMGKDIAEKKPINLQPREGKSHTPLPTAPAPQQSEIGLKLLHYEKHLGYKDSPESPPSPSLQKIYQCLLTEPKRQGIPIARTHRENEVISFIEKGFLDEEAGRNPAKFLEIADEGITVFLTTPRKFITFHRDNKHSTLHPASFSQTTHRTRNPTQTLFSPILERTQEDIDGNHHLKGTLGDIPNTIEKIRKNPETLLTGILDRMHSDIEELFKSDTPLHTTPIGYVEIQEEITRIKKITDLNQKFYEIQFLIETRQIPLLKSADPSLPANNDCISAYQGFIRYFDKGYSEKAYTDFVLKQQNTLVGTQQTITKDRVDKEERWINTKSVLFNLLQFGGILLMGFVLFAISPLITWNTIFLPHQFIYWGTWFFMALASVGITVANRLWKRGANRDFLGKALEAIHAANETLNKTENESEGNLSNRLNNHDRVNKEALLRHINAVIPLLMKDVWLESLHGYPKEHKENDLAFLVGIRKIMAETHNYYDLTSADIEKLKAIFKELNQCKIDRTYCRPATGWRKWLVPLGYFAYLAGLVTSIVLLHAMFLAPPIEQMVRVGLFTLGSHGLPYLVGACVSLVVALLCIKQVLAHDRGGSWTPLALLMGTGAITFMLLWGLGGTGLSASLLGVLSATLGALTATFGYFSYQAQRAPAQISAEERPLINPVTDPKVANAHPTSGGEITAADFPEFKSERSTARSSPLMNPRDGHNSPHSLFYENDEEFLQLPLHSPSSKSTTRNERDESFHLFGNNLQPQGSPLSSNPYGYLPVGGSNQSPPNSDEERSHHSAISSNTTSNTSLATLEPIQSPSKTDFVTPWEWLSKYFSGGWSIFNRDGEDESTKKRNNIIRWCLLFSALLILITAIFSAAIFSGAIASSWIFMPIFLGIGGLFLGEHALNLSSNSPYINLAGLCGLAALIALGLIPFGYSSIGLWLCLPISACASLFFWYLEQKYNKTDTRTPARQNEVGHRVWKLLVFIFMLATLLLSFLSLAVMFNFNLPGSLNHLTDLAFNVAMKMVGDNIMVAVDWLQILSIVTFVFSMAAAVVSALWLTRTSHEATTQEIKSDPLIKELISWFIKLACLLTPIILMWSFDVLKGFTNYIPSLGINSTTILPLMIIALIIPFLMELRTKLREHLPKNGLKLLLAPILAKISEQTEALFSFLFISFFVGVPLLVILPRHTSTLHLTIFLSVWVSACAVAITYLLISSDGWKNRWKSMTYRINKYQKERFKLPSWLPQEVPKMWMALGVLLLMFTALIVALALVWPHLSMPGFIAFGVGIELTGMAFAACFFCYKTKSADLMLKAFFKEMSLLFILTTPALILFEYNILSLSALLVVGVSLTATTFFNLWQTSKQCGDAHYVKEQLALDDQTQTLVRAISTNNMLKSGSATQRFDNNLFQKSGSAHFSVTSRSTSAQLTAVPSYPENEDENEDKCFLSCERAT